MLKVGGGKKGVASEFSLGRGRRRSKRSSKELRRRACATRNFPHRSKEDGFLRFHTPQNTSLANLDNSAYLRVDTRHFEEGKRKYFKIPELWEKRSQRDFFKKCKNEEKTSPSRPETKKTNLIFVSSKVATKTWPSKQKNFFLLFLVCGRWKESDAEQIGFCSGKKKRNEFVQRHLGLLHFSKRRREGKGGEKNSINPPYLYLAKKSYLRD